MDQIVDILCSKKDLSGWILREEKRLSRELFFIRDRLDMNRLSESCEYFLRIFVDSEDGTVRGESDVTLSASDSRGEIEERIQSGILAASYVENPYYPLPVGEGEHTFEDDYSEIEDLKNRYEELIEALFHRDLEDAKVNSCEIFAVEGSDRVVTSQGTDIRYPVGKFTFELITDASIEENCEIFRPYTLKTMDIERIAEIVTNQLEETRARSIAKRGKTQKNCTVIISGREVEEFFRFYLAQAQDAAIFRKQSRAVLGERFGKGDLTIRMRPDLPFSTVSRLCDDSGKLLKSYLLFEHGYVRNLTSTLRYSLYLGVEYMGAVRGFEVSPGDVSYSDIIKEDHIEILAFSAFLMDPVTGDFGGEFRLARKVEEGKVTYLTGGSLSHTVFDVQEMMSFTKEMAEYNGCYAPKAIILRNVTITE